MKLLIVDDEPLMRDAVQTLLEWRDYGIDAVFTACSAEEALSIHAEQNSDIIMTDIKMPGMDGLELVQKIRIFDGSSSNTSIIIFSAYDDFTYAKRAMQFGVIDYLLKPLNYDEVRNTIERIFLKSRQSKLNESEAANESVDAVNEELHEEIDKKPLKEVVRSTINYINTHYAKNISLGDITGLYHIDYCYMSKLFKKEAGMLFTEYVIKVRINKARELLSNPDLKIYEIGEMVGYKDLKHFRRVFREVAGVSPNDYRKNLCQ